MTYDMRWSENTRKVLTRGSTDHSSLISFVRGRQQYHTLRS